MILAEVLRKVGPDREAIRGELAKISNWQGVTQTYRADANGNLAHATVVVQFKPGTKDLVLVDKVSA
jgi:ABC-type branched-subunit amino acid transport system substrate-binding protein